MKKIIIIFSIITATILPQEVLSVDDFQREYEAMTIENFPDKLLPEGAGELLFAVEIPDYTLHLFIKMNDGMHLIQNFTEDIIFNYAKFNIAEYRDGVVMLNSQMPFRATVIINKFKWDGDRLNYIGEEVEDYSAELLSEADSLLEAGQVSGAIESYSNILYPQAYLNPDETALKIIKKAHRIALDSYKRGEYVDAAQELNNAFKFYGAAPFLDFQSPEAARDKFSYYTHIMAVEEFYDILADYGLFLLRAGMRDKSIEINEYVVTLDPSLSGPYLQLGDAYYEQNKNHTARGYYAEYSRLMNEAGKGDRIPSRVKERM